MDCRGQGYDNGSNMKGKNQGVQRRILDVNKRAFFVPCGCHSFNLVISDAAKSSAKTITLFGIIQRTFVLFSSSTHRWDLLSQYIKGLTLKSISETRWESRVDCVKSIRYQLCDVLSALQELSDEEKADCGIRHDAGSLHKHIKDYSFILLLIIWYEILFRINIISKQMQSVDFNLFKALDIIEITINFFQRYRDSSFEDVLLTANEISLEIDVEQTFPVSRRCKRKKFFDEPDIQEVTMQPQEKFRIDTFNNLIDIVLGSLQERFKQLKTYNDNFSIFYKLNTITDMSKIEIRNF